MEFPFSKNRSHKKLIIAALDPGTRGKKNFDSWTKTISLTDIDYPSQKMLSAIGHHLSNDELSEQIRKVAKFTWLRSQMLLRAGFRAESILVGSGIPTAWIKGTAILARTTTEISKRPMEDIDLLIPLPYVSTAAQCLISAGFECAGGQELISDPDSITSNLHALAFRDQTGAEVDIHWRAFKSSHLVDAENGIWERITQSELLEKKVSVISAEDLLIQTIATNREGNDAYWMLDAIRLIEDNNLNYKLLVQIAQQRQLKRILLLGLAEILAHRSTAVPAKYRLSALVTSVLYKFEYTFFKSIFMQNLMQIPKVLSRRNSLIRNHSGSGLKDKKNERSEFIELLNNSAMLLFSRESHDAFRSPLATRNWHQAEVGGTWSSAEFADVEFDLNLNAGSFIKATASFSIISSKYNRLRRVAILCNDKLVASKFLFKPVGDTQSLEFEIELPPGDSRIKLTFWVSGTMVPRKHFYNLDQRHLGIYLQNIDLKRKLP